MKRAFTLIELMVVVGIMAFLGVAATGGYSALQRGMAENGATKVAASLFKAAKERAMVDRMPTAVFCYNRLLREATDDENAVVVGEAVAVRRAGRVSWVSGNLLCDEFADLASSYDLASDESDARDFKGMKLWRFDADSGNTLSRMEYSVVSSAVVPVEINGWTFGGWAEGDAAGNSNLTVNAYAFVNLQTSGFEPSQWRVGNAYGFEFGTVQLPHNFTFGSGSVPSKVGDVSFAGVLFFDPDDYSTDRQIDVYFCRPDAGGVPRPHHKAGTASSKEN